jgi:hypothetical protein
VPTWQKSFPDHKPFKCSAYWHFKSSGLWLAIYDLVGAVTHGGELPFFATLKRVSAYFDADYETVRRIFKKMRRDGWLELRADGHHYYIPHDERAKKFPDECCKRPLLDWQYDTDPLVGHLYAVAGKKLKVRENWITGLRRFTTDEEFLVLFKKEIAAAQAKREKGNWEGTAAKECFWRVYRYLREQKTQVENAGYRQDA